MSNCPGPDRLLRLLEEDRPEVDQTEVAAHLVRSVS